MPKLVMWTEPIPLAVSNKFVVEHHRHHGKVLGHRWSMGLFDCDEVLRGVAIVGRPVARAFNHHEIVEVTRLCTDGAPNGCSMLYSACAREARRRGFKRIITYILETEPGTSLKASNWSKEAWVRGRSWSCKARPRNDKHPLVNKWRWGLVL